MLPKSRDQMRMFFFRMSIGTMSIQNRDNSESSTSDKTEYRDHEHSKQK